MKHTEHLLHNCLYFTANALARHMTRLAEQAFGHTGLSPSHAFVVMVVADTPGVGPTELAQSLRLAPSTITRFVDVLVRRGYLQRSSSGKHSSIQLTAQGDELMPHLSAAWKKLYHAYSEIIGTDSADQLTHDIDLAVALLEQH